MKTFFELAEALHIPPHRNTDAQIKRLMHLFERRGWLDRSGHVTEFGASKGLVDVTVRFINHDAPHPTPTVITRVCISDDWYDRLVADRTAKINRSPKPRPKGT